MIGNPIKEKKKKKVATKKNSHIASPQKAKFPSKKVRVMLTGALRAMVKETQKRKF
jgi:hypothetical protein